MRETGWDLVRKTEGDNRLSPCGRCLPFLICQRSIPLQSQDLPCHLSRKCWKGANSAHGVQQESPTCLTEMEYHLFMILWQWPRQRTRCHSLKRGLLSWKRSRQVMKLVLSKRKSSLLITSMHMVKPRLGYTTRR